MIKIYKLCVSVFIMSWLTHIFISHQIVIRVHKTDIKNVALTTAWSLQKSPSEVSEKVC